MLCESDQGANGARICREGGLERCIRGQIVRDQTVQRARGQRHMAGLGKGAQHWHNRVDALKACILADVFRALLDGATKGRRQHLHPQEPIDGHERLLHEELRLDVRQPATDDVRHHLLRLVVEESVVRHLDRDLGPAVKDQVATTEALKEWHNGGQERRGILSPEDHALDQRVEVGMDMENVHIHCAAHPVSRLMLGQEPVRLIGPVLVAEACDGIPKEGETLLALADALQDGRVLCGALAAGQLMGLDVVKEAQECSATVAPMALDAREDNTGLAARPSDHSTVAADKGDEIVTPERCNERIDVLAAPCTALHRSPVIPQLCSEIRRHLER